MDQSWVYNDSAVDWGELSELYRKAPLGEKSPMDLQTVFSNSRFKCFVYANQELIGVGRALADGGPPVLKDSILYVPAADSVFAVKKKDVLRSKNNGKP